ncbi:hypothetical protein GC176_20460 [bacterium]|nr:hypothetical protein [bacterium]
MNAVPFNKEAFRLAVKRGIQSGKVIVFWNLPSRMFIADCFFPGCTEGDLDCGFLQPYLWDLEFSKMNREGTMPTIDDIRGGTA